MPGPDAGMHSFCPGIFLHFKKFQSTKVMLSIFAFKIINFVAGPGLGLESIRILYLTESASRRVVW